MDKTIKLLTSLTERALEDGIITDDERALLKSVFEDLKDYNWWLQDALDDGIIDLSEEERLRKLLIKIYANALETALEDGVITEDERALLGHLRMSFGIKDDVLDSKQSKTEREKASG